MIGPAETIEILLRAGTVPDVLEELRNTPLHMAAIDGRCDVARCLINNGATINILNQTKISPMNLAMRHNHLALTEMMQLAGGNLTSGEIADLDRHFRLSYNDLSQQVRSQLRQIKTLKNLSMLTIRASLQTRIDEKMQKIALPNALKNYVTLADYS